MAQQYRKAAEVLETLSRSRTGLKTIIFGDRSIGVRLKKQVFALVSETLRYASVLDELFEQVDVSEVGTRTEMIRVMVFELVLGKHRRLVGGGALKKKLIELKPALENALAKLMTQAQVETVQELLPEERRRVEMPRYARVNTLVKSFDDTAAALLADGFTQVTAQAPVEQRDFRADDAVPNLLEFSPAAHKFLFEHDLVKSGALILQDKASCFTAAALDPLPEWRVIDGCAAPGNKTTQLATQAKQVLAYEIDERRCKLLRRRVHALHANKVISVVHGSFLDAQDDAVDAILLDPSCSGSGLVQHRADHLHQERSDVPALAAFQKRLLSHALTAFPGAQRVAYSTCSVHEEENEQVVLHALQTHPQWRLRSGCLPAWKRRGLASFDWSGLTPEQQHCDLSECLVRACPQNDRTNGFFVAVFERIPGYEVTETVDAPSLPAVKTAKKPATQQLGKKRTKPSAKSRKQQNKDKRRKLVPKSQNKLLLSRKFGL
ncbi:MAG: hypothetical protein MHM6MM_007008 [Cercozoa sp. M6MM]